jgi:hypothetical protein
MNVFNETSLKIKDIMNFDKETDEEFTFRNSSMVNTGFNMNT